MLLIGNFQKSRRSFTSVFEQKHIIMKNHLVLTIMFLLLTFPSLAQVSKRMQPDVLAGADSNCALRYYYYPNLGAYFDLKNTVYIYNDKGEWKKAPELPNGYMGYSLNNKLNVPILDYDDDDVIQFIEAHRKKFPPVRGRRMPATANNF